MISFEQMWRNSPLALDPANDVSKDMCKQWYELGMAQGFGHATAQYLKGFDDGANGCTPNP